MTCRETAQGAAPQWLGRDWGRGAPYPGQIIGYLRSGRPIRLIAGGAGWSLLQSASKGDADTAGNNSLAYSSNVSAGSKLIAVISCFDAEVTAVADQSSNAFTKVAETGPQNSDVWSSIWILDTPAGDVGTKPTITATCTEFASIVLLEVSGLAAGNSTAVLDGTPGYSGGTQTGTITSPSYTSTASNEFLITTFNCGNNAHTISGVSGSETYTIAQNIDGSAGPDATSIAVAYGNSGNTAETATWTISTGTPDWTAILVAFKLAGSGGTSSYTQQLPPSRFAPLSRKFPGEPFDIPVNGPLTSILTAPLASPSQGVPAQARKLPARRPGTGTGSPGTLGATIAGVSGSITVTGLAGNITAVTGSPGQVVKRLLPPKPGHGKGQPGTLGATVAGVSGSITVTAPSGSIQAVTGSPGQVVRRLRPPKPGYGRGSQGTISATVAGVSGSITVTAPSGSITAVTGSPGIVAKGHPAPKPGRWRANAGTLSQAIAGVSGSITVTGPAGSVTAVTGTPGQVARARTIMPPRRGPAYGSPGAPVTTSATGPSVVQSIGKAAGSGNCTFTLTSTPTVGNGLLAFCYYNDGFSLSAPSGSKWLLLTRTTKGHGGARMDVYWHIVQSGDGTSWTFPVTGDYTSGQLYEITGANNQFPVSGIAIGGSSTGAASIVSPSATPAFNNSLAFAAETDNNGTAISSVTSGWTLLQDTGTFHGGGSAYNPTLTSSAATCTFTMSGTSTGYGTVTVLISPAPATAATLYPLQNALHQAATGNIVLTFSASPAVGNLMLAVVSWNGGQTQTPPTGWTQIFAVNNTPANDSLGAYYRVVQSGDSTSYTWTLSGDYGSGELYELTGASTTSPVNGYQTAIDDSTLTSRTTPSVTPTVLNCLAFACETTDGTGDAISSVSSGWTYLSGHLTYHGSSSAYRNTPTADTSTGITNTFTYTAAAGPGADATILIAPAAQAPPPSAPLNGMVAKARPAGKPARGRAAGISSGTLSQAIAGVSGSITVTAPSGSVTAVTGSPGQVAKGHPAPKPGRWRANAGTLSQAITGVSGSITVTGLAGNVTAVTGSPGQVIRRRRPVPRKGYGTGVFVATPLAGTVPGSAGSIIVIAPAGSVTAVTGSPGRTIRRGRPVPRKGYGAGTRGTLGATVAGVTGSITVTGLSGTIQAVTGSPGQVARARPAPKPGRWHGTKGTLGATIAGVTGSITVTGFAGNITAVTGSPGRRIASRTAVRTGHVVRFAQVSVVIASGSIPGVPGVITVAALPGTVVTTVSLPGPAGTITVTAIPGTVAIGVPGSTGTITVSGSGGFVTNVPPRRIRWDIDRGFIPAPWRSHVVAGNTGNITVSAPAGTITATNPATGMIAVSAPPGTVAASYAAPRYIRWDIGGGFAPAAWRSHVTSGNPGNITVTAPPGTVTAQYFTMGKADAAGRIIKSATRMPPRHGGKPK